MAASWFILCRVVDHYGDAGVCWRLARQLACEYGLDVTLFIDDVGTLQRLLPALVPEQERQRIDGVTVQRLTEALPSPAAHRSCWPAVIIDAFGGGLPSSWLTALARDFPPSAVGVAPEPAAPHWLVLEYLSAEPWVETMHGLASPPPAIGIPRHFFFPGFTAATGGLLREKTLLDEREAFGQSPSARRSFLERLGVAPPPAALLVSLFCYDTPALPALLDVWAASPLPIVGLLPDTVAPATVRRWRSLHGGVITTNNATVHGALTLHTIPFLPQTDFDRLLWSCDLNFVRGEDSFVRAQWAAQPFIWQAYRQDEQTRLSKVDAFLARFLAEAPAELKTVLTEFFHVWNDERQTERLARAWPALVARLPALAGLAQGWTNARLMTADLASRLTAFCAGRSPRK